MPKKKFNFNREYWEQRYSRLGDLRTVGRRDFDLKEYKEGKKRLLEIFNRHILPGNSVLDFGCGFGRFYRFLKKKFSNYVGMDIVDRVRYNFPFILIHSKLPILKVDAIFSCFVLQHVIDDKLLNRYFRWFRRSTKYLYFMEEIALEERIRKDAGKIYLKFRTVNFYRELLKNSNFKIDFEDIFGTQYFVRAK